MRRELEIIYGDLRCTAVRICGLGVDRVVTAAEMALEAGLETWLSPEMWDHEPVQVLDYLAGAARAAEVVRRRWPGRVVLSVGSELTLFMRGILPGDTVLDRVGSPVRIAQTMLRLKVLRTHNKPLNCFLAQAASAARDTFRGPLTYASVPIEAVDWTPFDIVSVDYYRGKKNRRTYGEGLRHYLADGKPVVVTEVGCCTYQGAEDKGGRGFLIVDRKQPDQVKADYVRDEALQAHEVSYMLGVIQGAGVDGAFVYGFASPTLIHQPDPLHDFDMASYSLVKALPAPAADSTYPGMSWEPKQSFGAVADFYNAT